jgi:hypothetical protein
MLRPRTGAPRSLAHYPRSRFFIDLLILILILIFIMPNQDNRIDAYIAKSADFAKPILTHLRALVHQACPEAEETIKWGFPHFTHHGLLCAVAAFKGHCTFGFWRGSEIFGQGRGLDGKEKTAMGHFGKIASLADLPADDVLIAFVKQAAALNEKGPKPPPPKPTVKKNLAVPDFFMAALRRNKKALAAFTAYSPSHKREYVQWVVEAKREETRQKRLASTVARLAQGKSRHAEYERG